MQGLPHVLSAIVEIEMEVCLNLVVVEGVAGVLE